MKESKELRHPVLKSVLIVAAVGVGIIAAWLAAIYAFNVTPSKSSGSATTLFSTIAGASWFRWRANRPMLHRERLGFAAGVTFVNAGIPFIYVVAALLWFGLPLTLASYDLAFGDGKGFLIEPAVFWLMLFVLGLVFVEAYFFGWLLSRNRQKKATPAPE
jgi:hypothetical protein